MNQINNFTIIPSGKLTNQTKLDNLYIIYFFS